MRILLISTYCLDTRTASQHTHGQADMLQAPEALLFQLTFASLAHDAGSQDHHPGPSGSPPLGLIACCCSLGSLCGPRLCLTAPVVSPKQLSAINSCSWLTSLRFLLCARKQAVFLSCSAACTVMSAFDRSSLQYLWRECRRAKQGAAEAVLPLPAQLQVCLLSEGSALASARAISAGYEKGAAPCPHSSKVRRTAQALSQPGCRSTQPGSGLSPWS